MFDEINKSSTVFASCIMKDGRAGIISRGGDVVLYVL
jgi:hypothetical protein